MREEARRIGERIATHIVDIVVREPALHQLRDDQAREIGMRLRPWQTHDDTRLKSCEARGLVDPHRNILAHLERCSTNVRTYRGDQASACLR